LAHRVPATIAREDERDRPRLVATQASKSEREGPSESPARLRSRERRDAEDHERAREGFRDGRDSEPRGVGKGRGDHGSDDGRTPLRSQPARSHPEQHCGYHTEHERRPARHGHRTLANRHHATGEPERERQPARAAGIEAGCGRKSFRDHDARKVVVRERTKSSPEDSEGDRGLQACDEDCVAEPRPGFQVTWSWLAASKTASGSRPVRTSTCRCASGGTRRCWSRGTRA
jgi:hypothetical protein